jgi:hypothetical protein
MGQDQHLDGRSGAAAPSGHQPSASAVPASQSGVPNAVRLTELEQKALVALAEGRDAYAPWGHACYSFKAIAAIGGIETHLVRRAVRRLARRGLAEFHKGLWSEDGEPRGAGYGLSKAGCDALDALVEEAVSCSA